MYLNVKQKLNMYNIHNNTLIFLISLIQNEYSSTGLNLEKFLCDWEGKGEFLLDLFCNEDLSDDN